MRTWHDRFRADGIWTDVAALLTGAMRARQGRKPEPRTAILNSQSVVCGPQAGELCGNLRHYVANTPSAVSVFYRRVKLA